MAQGWNWTASAWRKVEGLKPEHVTVFEGEKKSGLQLSRTGSHWMTAVPPHVQLAPPPQNETEMLLPPHSQRAVDWLW